MSLMASKPSMPSMRVVNSETSLVGVEASIPTILRKSLTACDALAALPPSPRINNRYLYACAFFKIAAMRSAISAFRPWIILFRDDMLLFTMLLHFPFRLGWSDISGSFYLCQLTVLGIKMLRDIAQRSMVLLDTAWPKPSASSDG